MNPPSALHGAMSRDRKPFTYTPGGLDLSEIKSERMAKRLMRNAMNQGVPEVPVQNIQSPPMPFTPIAVPNYNCLPVQVFPTFNLPANPKTLLRTRSVTDQPRESPIQRVIPPSQFINNPNPSTMEYYDSFNKNTPTYSQVNNNRPVSMFEYGTLPSYNNTLPSTNFGSDRHLEPVLPEIRYDAEYLQAPRKVKTPVKMPSQIINDEKKTLASTEISDCVSVDSAKSASEKTDPAPVVSKSVEEEANADQTQKEVKVVKTQVKKENKVEKQNGNKDGDGSVEAELVVKLPTKKTGAKTETKVEVVKKILPDGTVEEVKTTTTKTTIDGKTEIKTRTETRTLPKEEAEEEIEEVEEEETGEAAVEEVEEEVEEPQTTVTIKQTSSPKENGHDDAIVKTEERSETTTTSTKKVVIVQDEPEEEEEEVVEEEVVEDEEPVTIVLKKSEAPEKVAPEQEEEEVEEEEAEEVEEEVKITESNEVKEDEEVEEVEEQESTPEEEKEKEEVEVEEDEADQPVTKEEELKEVEKATENDEDEVEEEEEYEEAKKEETEPTEVVESKKEEKENVAEPENEQEEEDEKEETTEETLVQDTDKNIVVENETQETQKEQTAEVKEIKVEVKMESESDEKTQKAEEKEELKSQPEIKIPLREPSIPLEKVEDIEIKPIGPASEIIKKTHTEIISSTTDNPSGALSTQTEYNRIENIVTVNRTLKTLDHSYDNLTHTQEGIPKLPTYFTPNRDRVLASPLPNRPYQPVYAPEPQPERRHSLLLERLSMDRQLPTDIYQNNYQYSQSYEEQSQEPQSEVLTVSNVKPSSISRERQDWYQQVKRENSVFNNNVLSTPPIAPQQSSPSPIWNQTHTRPQPTPQPQSQPLAQPQPQYQPTYTDISQERSNTYSQNTYQQQNTYQPSYTTPTYTPKPIWAANNANIDPVPNISTPTPYSYQTTDTTDNYQKSSQQYSSSYVPPPWEQDTSYIADTSNQNYYQPPPPASQFTPSQTWKPTPPPSKFSKPVPKAYIPPAPNQSFVKPVTNIEPPKTPGRKTYYSEYERRYISVPEATYIPGDNKFQPQPDPSPQYYYDNNEPAEVVEPQWRKELREFTEKTTLTQTETTSVKPPWEAEPKYGKANPATYTPTPTWSQTLRPRSWRERSYDAEYIGSQEWPKTNTLGRGRPLSSGYKSVDAPIPERTRGVSVDRYNPNNYQSPIPAEHPPVQTHILTTPIPHAGYHNPNVPSYHARASAEPREQPYYPQQARTVREPRASPFQSRSFKYLQWITGTED